MAELWKRRMCLKVCIIYTYVVFFFPLRGGLFVIQVPIVIDNESKCRIGSSETDLRVEYFEIYQPKNEKL